MKRNNKILQYIFILVERILLILSIVLYSFVWIAALVLDHIFSNKYLIDFLTLKLGKYLAVTDASLVTVATVFIGIYFTIYTMLISIQSDSVLANLEKDDFKKILKILTIGFISSFVYTLYSVFFKISFENYPRTTTFFILFLALLFFISAFQFGVLLTLILRQDIYGAIKKIEERKHEDARKEALLVQLESFLNDQSEQENLRRSNEMSERIRSKEEKSTYYE